MRKTSKYFGLEYLVQCCWPERHSFETIAAFGFGSVASDYAKEVMARQEKAGIPGWRFRVVHYKNNEPTCVWRSDEEPPKDTVTDPQSGLMFEITRYVPSTNPVNVDLSICGSKPLK